jgi:hypothetical protein
MGWPGWTSCHDVGTCQVSAVSAVSGATDFFFGMSEFRGSVLSIDQGELRGKKSRFLLNSLEKPNPGTQGPNAILSAVRDFSVTMES